METPGNDEPSPTDRPGPSAEGAPTAPTPPPTVPPTAASVGAARPFTPPTPPTTPPGAGRGGPGAPTGGDGPSGPHRALDEVEHIFEGGLDGDWPARTADAIVNVVGAVRDRTTGPITTVARGLVFGVFAGVLGIAVAVVLLIAAIRLLDQVLPSGVWVAYLVLGALFVIAGALVFRKRNQPAPAGNSSRP